MHYLMLKLGEASVTSDIWLSLLIAEIMLHPAGWPKQDTATLWNGGSNPQPGSGSFSEEDLPVSSPEWQL